MKREDIFQKAENSVFDEILSFLLEFPCPGAARVSASTQGWEWVCCGNSQNPLKMGTE